MDRRARIFLQAKFAARMLPHVAKRTKFALKGGTAINFFWRDLPRLSVDIDLVYLPRTPRKQALPAIRQELREMKQAMETSIPGLSVQTADISKKDSLRLWLTLDDRPTKIDPIKIELSPVMRGTVRPAETRRVTPSVEDTFGYAENPIVSFDDLYAGKMCAALDRQHPRDLFDIAQLLDNEGIDRSLFKTFLVYLISHNRPMANLLDPNRKDIRVLYESALRTITLTPVSLDSLVEARERLVAGIHAALTDRDRAFLMSVKNRKPDWTLLDLPDIADLPAVKWKLYNLGRMSGENHAAALGRLQRVLDAGNR